MRSEPGSFSGTRGIRDGLGLALGLGGGCLALRLVGPAPLALLWIFTALAFAATVVVRTSGIRVAALAAVSVLFSLSLFESGLALRSKLSPNKTHYGDHYRNYYSEPDPQLGYRVNPSQEVRAEKFDSDGNTIYSTIYTIDEGQTRVVPGGESSNRQGTVLFFGCSMVFGEGVGNDETLPSYFARASDSAYQVINYGLHGYGPHHALRILELDIAAPRLTPPVVAAIYELIPTHLERAAGQASWDHHGPRYVVNSQGVAVFQGPFLDPGQTLRKAVHKSRLYVAMRGMWEMSEERKLELAVAILSRMDALVDERYGVPLHILYWDEDSDRSQRLVTAVSEAGLRVDLVSRVIPISERAAHGIPGDGHPNPVANRKLAEALASTLAKDRAP